MKKYMIGAVVLACCLQACSRRPDSPSPSVQAAPPATTQTAPPGRITIPADSPKLQQISVADVQMRDIAVDQVVAPGKIDVNPNRVSRVTIPVAGKVVDVLVRIGDSVRQGQPVLLIESSEADTAMSTALQAEASLTQSRAALIKAQSDYDRAKDLFAGQAGPKKDVLTAEAALAQAKAAVEQAEAAKNQADARLDLLGLKRQSFRQKIEIHAPISGKVLDMSVVPGEYRNDTSNPVMTIADLSSVWVVSEVPESTIRMIEKGERLEVELTAYPDQRFQARVTRIADMVDPTTRTVKVYAEVSNTGGRLRPEMYGRIRHVDATRPMPVIPSSAVIQAEKQTKVYREITPGTFEPVSVTLGSRDGNSIGVLNGLEPHDRVVVDGAMLLKGY
ncbi:MAG TPA: efflux RND transporter periplasmic adaptor subunit [Bryobacteraceae bacterium]|jgi:cobalt-zinc-cadmium efflux system membrane fusion protein|nr:efflux RND transporter periplasmic adaptor subunit [Bryobacteraceae bacterium]